MRANLAMAMMLAGTVAGLSARAAEPLRIGVVGDMSSLYEAVSGPGAVTAVRMAVEDFGGSVLDRPIEVLSADHQNKPDIAAGIVRKWYDLDHVSVVADVVGSASSLAVSDISRDRRRIMLATNGATSELNGKSCSPFTIQYRSDTYAEAKATTRGLLAAGGDTWFTIAADYALGFSLENDIKTLVTAAGGKVIGGLRHPINNPDFSSYMLAAQASGAKVIALANAGGDMINSLKSAAEFGLLDSKTQKVTGLLVFISDVQAVGLPTLHGLVLETDFYWDMDERTRDFSERFFKRTGRMPTMSHAANYSAVTNYLKAVRQSGTDDATTVAAALHAMKIDDMFARNAYIRPDGLLIHDLYLVQVKSPAESHRAWDNYKILTRIPGDEAFRPLAESVCPLVHH